MWKVEVSNGCRSTQVVTPYLTPEGNLIGVHESCEDDASGSCSCQLDVQFDTGPLLSTTTMASPYHCRTACKADDACVVWDYDGSECRLRIDVGDGANDAYTGSIGGGPGCSMKGLGLGLEVGDRMWGGDSIRSLSGDYRVDMQTDGNFVMYDSAGYVCTDSWCNWTGAGGGAYVDFQSYDGNLVYYKSWGEWGGYATETGFTDSAYFIMQNDRNLVMYDGDMNPTWNSGTGL